MCPRNWIRPRRTLGALDALTVEDARHAVRAMFAQTQANGAPAAVPTVRTFARGFLADCAERWKPATRRAHADGIRHHILPAFGGRRVDAVTAKDVRNWFDDLLATRAGTANRALAVLSSMMKHAEALGLRREDSNPCKGLRRRKTGFEAHYLTDDEFAALGRALDEAAAGHPVAVGALRFLLYTGARKAEALRLKWEYVHGDRAVLPDSKTSPRTIWLASPACAVLAAQPRRINCPWVFPSSRGEPANVDREWHAIREAAAGGMLLATDVADLLVAAGVPFRTAHETVGGMVRDLLAAGRDFESLTPEAWQRYDPRFPADAGERITAQASVAARRTPQSTGPAAVRAALDEPAPGSSGKVKDAREGRRERCLPGWLPVARWRPPSIAVVDPDVRSAAAAFDTGARDSAVVVRYLAVARRTDLALPNGQAGDGAKKIGEAARWREVKTERRGHHRP